MKRTENRVLLAALCVIALSIVAYSVYTTHYRDDVSAITSGTNETNNPHQVTTD